MLYGYAGKILKVDLTTKKLTDVDSSQYYPDYVGGIGLGWRMLWENTNEKTTEWSPENTLTFASGPVNGSCIPTQGRQEVVGLASNSYPKPWGAESGSGGDWSTKLKWAGYDAVVVSGKSETPVYIHISEKGAELLDARSLWGMGSYSVQERMEDVHGKETATLTIGPAGEGRFRQGTIETCLEGSMGQGGFGAVMGDKKLKCIAVTPGSKKVTFADPEGLIRVAQKISYELAPRTANNLVTTNETSIRSDAASTSAATGYSGRRMSCVYSACQANDHDCLYTTYNKVPSNRGYSNFTLCGGCAAASGLSGGVLSSSGGRNTSAEMHDLMSNWGINTWSSTFGSIVNYAHTAGLMSELDGMALNEKHQLDVDRTIQWFRDCVNRTGPDGAAWAEGGARAAAALGWGDASSSDPAEAGVAWRVFKHGYTPHWDGRTQGPHFPMWVGSALDWAVWGRDPFNDSHGFPERVPWYLLEWGGKGSNKDMTGRDALPYDDLKKAAAKLYGTTGIIQNNPCPDAMSGWPGLPDDHLGYTDKEYVMYWHNHQEWFKNCMVMCDCVLPLLFSTESPDGLGYYTAEEDAFNAATGLNWTVKQCHEHMEKVFNLMRAVHIRQGRTRAHDESVIRFFTDIASNGSTYEQRNLNKAEFQALLSRYYKLRGWDPVTGIPTRSKLVSLGLTDVADGLAKVVTVPP